MKSVNRIFNLIYLAGLFFLSACASKSAPDNSSNSSADKVLVDLSMNSDFNDYWYSGKAEISSYELTQARYGELHPGTEVLVFVTEDYNTVKQVKRELPSDDAYTSVLKLNRMKKFTTGIYDYSMMSSIFQGVDLNKFPRAFKINSSSQDWCGHTWSSLTWGENGYRQHLDSYFEAEVVEDRDIAKVMSEDEIFTLIRLNPDALPQGKFRMIPSLNYSRFSHEKLIAEECSSRSSIKFDDNGKGEYTYILNYTSGRELKITFDSNFPYAIHGWEEKRKSGFGPNAGWLKTTAKLKKTIKSDYWTRNGVDDATLRKSLGL